MNLSSDDQRSDKNIGSANFPDSAPEMISGVVPANDVERYKLSAIMLARALAAIGVIISLISLVQLSLVGAGAESGVSPWGSILAVMFTVAALIGWYWVVRQNTFQGVAILYVSSMLLVLLYPLLTYVPGFLVGAVLFALIFGTAPNTLPASWSGRVIALGLFVSGITVLLDLYFPDARVGRFSFINNLVALSIALFFVVLIFRRFPGYSLSTKLIIALILVSIIPFALLAVMNFMQTRNRLQETLQSDLLDTSSQAARAVDTFISDQMQAVRSAAQLPELVDYLSLPSDQRAQSAQETRAQRVLLALSRRDPLYISSYALLDSDGFDVMDTYIEDVGLRKADRLYFTEPMRTGLTYVSPLLYSKTAGISGVYFSSPIKNSRGQSLGVLRVRYSADVFQEILQSALRETAYAEYMVLVDENYFIRIAHTKQPSLIFKSYASLDAAQVAELQKIDLLPPGAAEDLATNQQDVVDALSTLEMGEEGYFTLSSAALEEEAGLAGAVHLRQAPWIVMSRISLSQALAPTQRLVFNATLMAEIVVALVALIALWITSLFTGPVSRLSKVAERITQGDLNARARVETQDEVGDLTETFNALAEQMQTTLAGLEQRVADRSHVLELSASISRQLASILDIEQLVRAVVQQIQAAFQYYHVHIYLLDEKQENLVMVGGSGEVGRILLERHHHIPAGRGLVGRSAATRSVVLVPDTFADPGWLPNPLLPDTRSEVALPILTTATDGGEVVLGVLDVQQNQVGALGQQDVDILTGIADQVGTALRNARLYAQAQYRTTRESLLADIVQQIQSTRTFESALQVTAREVGRVVQSPLTQVYYSSSSWADVQQDAEAQTSVHPDQIVSGDSQE